MSTETSSEEPTRPGKLRARILKAKVEGDEPPVDLVPDEVLPEVEPVKVDVDEEETKTTSTGSRVIKKLREDEDQNLVDFIKGLSSDDAPFRIALIRREPKTHPDPLTGRPRNVHGQLATYDRQIDEEEIAREHGGGTYLLRVSKRNSKGRWEYAAARTVQVAGDPRLDNLPTTATPEMLLGRQQAPAPAPDPNAPLMAKVVDRLFSERDRPAPPQVDMMPHIKMAVEPLMEANRRLEQRLDARERELAEARQPKTDDFKDKLLDKMIDQDSSRLQAVRAQYDSEIRMLKQSFIDDEKRIRDAAERDRQFLQQSHEREIRSLEAANATKIAAIEQSLTLSKSLLEAENRRLQREVDDLRVEVKELRNKKEPSLRDKVAEIRDFKDLLSDDDGDGDKDKSPLVKIAEAAASSEVIGGFVQRVMAGAGQAPQGVPQAPQVQAQVHTRPPRARGPRLIRDRRNGQVYATDGTKAIPVQRRQQQVVAPPPVPAEPVVEGVEEAMPVATEGAEAGPPPVEQQAQVEVPIPYIPPETVTIATQYLLTAYSNKTDPQAVASSVRAYLSNDVIEAIRAMGVVNFLRRVGNLPPSSPLLEQHGKNWCRLVAKHLTGEA